MHGFVTDFGGPKDSSPSFHQAVWNLHEPKQLTPIAPRIENANETAFLRINTLIYCSLLSISAQFPPIYQPLSTCTYSSMFSVIIPGRPCLTDIVAVDAQPGGQATKFAFNFPLAPSFSEIVVFCLPGTVLPQDTAAAIYIQYPGSEFRFIGALANEKPSSVIKAHPPRRTEAEDEDQMLDEGNSGNAANNSAAVTLGISIEPVQVVAPQLATLEQERGENNGKSTDLVRQTPQQKGITTKVLAQRIIGNAFNFLASFAASDSSGRGQELVPMKAFQDWWTKFERRITVDPTFLEKEDPGASG